MRPDPYKQKASRKYQAKHRNDTKAKPGGKQQTASDSSGDSNQPASQTQAEHIDSAHAPESPLNKTPDDATSSTPEEPSLTDASARQPKAQPEPRSQFSRRRLQDNSWRYVEETEIDEEAMLNARIREAEEQEELKEILQLLKSRPQQPSDNKNIRDRQDLLPQSAHERRLMLEELRREILVDEFTEGYTAPLANNLAIETISVPRIRLDELAPGLNTNKHPNAPDVAVKDATREDMELDALLDDLL